MHMSRARPLTASSALSMVEKISWGDPEVVESVSNQSFEQEVVQHIARRAAAVYNNFFISR